MIIIKTFLDVDKIIDIKPSTLAATNTAAKKLEILISSSPAFIYD